MIIGKKLRKLARDPNRFFYDMLRKRVAHEARQPPEPGAPVEPQPPSEWKLPDDPKQLSRLVNERGFRLLPEKLSAEYLRRFGFTPRTVFDVGVSTGTKFLYALFPGVPMVLIDPLPNCENTVRNRFPMCKNLIFVAAALGAESGTAILHLQSDNLSKSTLQRGTRLEGRNTFKEIEVAVLKLDDLVRERNFEGPFGLKLDTEGHELEILRGATETLKHTQFVIAEVSIKRRYENGYRFSEIVDLLAGQGFELIDVLNPTKEVSKFFDCLFVRADSPLFSSRSI